MFFLMVINMSSDNLDLPPLALLQLLGDGKNHSGQELAGLLNVSRTAIWKQLAKIEALGLELLSQSGKGYCLVGGLELLEKDIISSYLTPSAANQISHFALLKQVDSTNSYLMRQEQGAGIDICFAEFQTAGRGRRGRQWVSPFASNIYLSLRLSVNGGLGALEGISLAVGVAVAGGLTELGVTGIQLKWPNDVLWSGKKLGGILIEVVGDPSGLCHLVVGLGLNLRTEKSMADTIDQPWVALDTILSVLPSRNRVAACLLNHIVPLLSDYETNGFVNYKAAWESLNAHADQQVDLFMGSLQTTGLVRGLNSAGALLLETDRGLEVFHGGEVSLRTTV
jgi:BirA family transcriptional regulator, biotin operon repressor / biotin---[acetyl-CoA-carboxylase] ligase